MILKVISRQLTAVELGLHDGFHFSELIGTNSAAFLFDQQGLLGWGEALRLETYGPNRIQELDRLWKEVVSQADVFDLVKVPGSGLISFGSITFSEHSKHSSILVVPNVVIGKKDGTLWLTTIDIKETVALSQIYRGNPLETANFEPGQIGPDKYRANVDKALASIESKQVEKVVLARDLKATVSKSFNVNAVLRELERKFTTCYIYCVDGFFGASPELLVKVVGSKVSARVLAGTAGRGTDPGVDLAIGTALYESEKNRSEHKFAVDSLVNSLKEVCEDVASDSTPFSFALPNLWHLASEVRATLTSDSSSLGIVTALHPSAAVAGTPRIAAQELIEEIERVDRGRYAGPVGWLGADGDGTWAIGLRGAQLTNSTLTAFAGCGIVAESNSQAELDEATLKFKAIVDVLS